MISKKTKYAIIALKLLSKEYEQGAIQIKTIAEKGKIPKKFLESILIDLKNAGILASIKGRSGGYYLKKNPADVNLATIIRIFNGPIGMVPCVTHVYYEPCEECENEKTCGIREAFKKLRDESVRILKESTFLEIIKSEEKLLNKE